MWHILRVIVGAYVSIIVGLGAGIVTVWVWDKVFEVGFEWGIERFGKPRNVGKED